MGIVDLLPQMQLDNSNWPADALPGNTLTPYVFGAENGEGAFDYGIEKVPPGESRLIRFSLTRSVGNAKFIIIDQKGEIDTCVSLSRPITPFIKGAGAISKEQGASSIN